MSGDVRVPTTEPFRPTFQTESDGSIRGCANLSDLATVSKGSRKGSRKSAERDITDAVAMDGENRLLSVTELAEYLAVPVATLYAWRYRGEGPPALRVGRYLRYRWSDVHDGSSCESPDSGAIRGSCQTDASR